MSESTEESLICSKLVFDYGEPVGIYNMPKEEAEARCKRMTARSEYVYDWHYMAGRVRILRLAKDFKEPKELKMKPIDIARVCHQVNRAYCQALGDMTQPTWEEAPDWQKDSAINGVKFHIQNPKAGPDSSHLEWYKQKEQEGWVYGPAKDPVKKEHPCMVDYDQLPKEQQAKDYVFREIVHSLSQYLE